MYLLELLRRLLRGYGGLKFRNVVVGILHQEMGGKVVERGRGKVGGSSRLGEGGEGKLVWVGSHEGRRRMVRVVDL